MKLIAENLSKNFAEKAIFKNINFEVDTASCLAILGPNGSGKTTLMRILSNLLRPSAGRVRYLDGEKEFKAEEVYRQIGFLGPYLELYQDLTAEENLSFFSRIRGLHNHQQRVANLMQQFGLKGREKDALKTYSSGMQQRLKYVFALLHEPQVLFVDEPRSNLDEKGIATVYEVLESYKKSHLLIMATNDSEDLKLADAKVWVNV